MADKTTQVISCPYGFSLDAKRPLLCENNDSSESRGNLSAFCPGNQKSEARKPVNTEKSGESWKEVSQRRNPHSS